MTKNSENQFKTKKDSMGLVEDGHPNGKDQRWKNLDQTYVPGLMEPSKPAMENEDGKDGINHSANVYG